MRLKNVRTNLEGAKGGYRKNYGILRGAKKEKKDFIP